MEHEEGAFHIQSIFFNVTTEVQESLLHGLRSHQDPRFLQKVSQGY